MCRCIDEYPEENPKKVGDTIFWCGKAYTVGNDFGEIIYWRGSEEGLKTHIVTTCGRVLAVDAIK